MSRKEKEYLTRRADILMSAEKLFAERGFYGTTMSDLSSLAEFSVGSLYKFFKSKEEVYYTLILEKLDLFHLRLDAQVNQYPAGLDGIRALIEACLKFTQENQGFFKIYWLERPNLGATAGSSLAEDLRRKYLHVIDLFQQVMEKAIEKGELREMDPRNLSFALAGIINSFVQESQFHPTPEDVRSMAPFIYDLFVKGTIKGHP